MRPLRAWARPGALRFAPALSAPGRALCAEHGIEVEYHFLSGYHPDWIEEKSGEDRAALQRRHMLETVR